MIRHLPCTKKTITAKSRILSLPKIEALLGGRGALPAKRAYSGDYISVMAIGVGRQHRSPPSACGNFFFFSPPRGELPFQARPPGSNHNKPSNHHKPACELFTIPNIKQPERGGSAPLRLQTSNSEHLVLKSALRSLGLRYKIPGIDFKADAGMFSAGVFIASISEG